MKNILKVLLKLNHSILKLNHAILKLNRVLIKSILYN